VSVIDGTRLRAVARRLRDAGVDSAEHDARVLLTHSFGDEAVLDDLVAMRAARVPLQHLTGTAGFRYLDLAVGPGVFVPRPETELLVDAVLAVVSDVASPVVVDLCAGSGAIGLSVAHECDRATVHLVERSAAAFEWLRRNAVDRPRVQIHQADLADAPTGLDAMVDVVVSNPPYIPLDEQDLVDPEVREHDPAEALWAGGDGLDVIARVADRARVLLRPGGRLVVEHSERHAESVPSLLRGAGFVDVTDHLDLTGRPRFAVATYPNEATT
jgi:release factor glutamine methyltransferase